jgi:hypothetical protein
MSSEASLIAKKLNNYLYVKNEPKVWTDRELAEMQAFMEDEEPAQSLWKTALSVVLMAIIVRLTKWSLMLTRIVKRLES